MAKPLSKLGALIGRIVKTIVGLLLVPLVIGLVLAIAAELESLGGGHVLAQWFVWGVLGYAIMHLFFYKPTAVFRTSHALLARISAWLFGGQVATVGAEGASPKPPKGKKQKGNGKADSASPAAQGSTLVVLSPYLVPLYVVLVAIGVQVLSHWIQPEVVQRVGVLLIGLAIAMHVVMTADDLQADRERFPIEMYVMSLAISGLVSLAMTVACLPLVVPEFDWLGVFADALRQTRAIYATAFSALFL